MRLASLIVRGSNCLVYHILSGDQVAMQPTKVDFMPLEEARMKFTRLHAGFVDIEWVIRALVHDKIQRRLNWIELKQWLVELWLVRNHTLA